MCRSLYVDSQYLAGPIIVQLQQMQGLHLQVACYACIYTSTDL